MGATLNDYTSWETYFRNRYMTDEKGCYLWLQNVDTHGYGQARFRGRLTKAHRISYRLHHAVDLPKGGSGAKRICVCHSCDVPACINTKHLFLGTVQDNMEDRDLKGRGARLGGDKHGMAKLTKEAVAEIRACTKRRGNFLALIKKFKVTYSTIWDIRTGRSWRGA